MSFIIECDEIFKKFVKLQITKLENKNYVTVKCFNKKLKKRLNKNVKSPDI